MKFERKTILTLTKEERNFLYRFYWYLTDEFDDIDFGNLLDDISCNASTYNQGDIVINIEYEDK